MLYIYKCLCLLALAPKSGRSIDECRERDDGRNAEGLHGALIYIRCGRVRYAVGDEVGRLTVFEILERRGGSWPDESTLYMSCCFYRSKTFCIRLDEWILPAIRLPSESKQTGCAYHSTSSTVKPSELLTSLAGLFSENSLMKMLAIGRSLIRFRAQTG